MQPHTLQTFQKQVAWKLGSGEPSIMESIFPIRFAGFSEEVLKDVECRKAVISGVGVLLSKGANQLAFKLTKAFELTDEERKDPEIKKGAQVGLLKALQQSNFESAIKIKSEHLPLEEDWKEIAIVALQKRLAAGLGIRLNEYLAAFPLSAEELSTHAMQSAAVDCIIHYLKMNFESAAFEIKDRFQIDKTPSNYPKINQTIRDILKELNTKFNNFNSNRVNSILGRLPVPQGILEETGIRKRIIDEHRDNLEKGEVNSAEAKEKILEYSEQDRTTIAIQAAALKGFEVHLLEKPETSIRLRERYKLPQGQTEAVVLKHFADQLQQQNHSRAADLLNQYGIQSESVVPLLLNNKEINVPIAMRIPLEMLHDHFSNPENQTADEYARVYTLFAPEEFYAPLLEEWRSSTSGRSTYIAVLGAMGARSTTDPQRRTEIRNDLFVLVEDELNAQRPELHQALVRLGNAGDGGIVERAEKLLSAQRNSEMSHTKKCVLGVLMEIKTPGSKEVLFDCLVRNNLDVVIKRHILSSLLEPKGNQGLRKQKSFFTPNVAELAENLASGKESSFDWKDFRFLRAVRSISNQAVRNKTLEQFDAIVATMEKAKEKPDTIHRAVSPNIPEESFAHLWQFADADVALLKKFDAVYQSLSRSRDRESLHIGIVELLSVKPEIRHQVKRVVQDVEITSVADARALSQYFKMVGFLDQVSRLGDEESPDSRLKLPKVNSIVEATTHLKGEVVSRVRSLLKNPNITADTIEAIHEHWGSLEPIFMYASKMRANDCTNLSYLGKIIEHLDPENNYAGWKKWRYDLGRKSVKDQIGMLNEEQRAIWSRGVMVELGPIMSQPIADNSEAVFAQICSGIEQHHMTAADISDTTEESRVLLRDVQDQLIPLLTETKKSPAKRRRLFTEHIDSISRDLEAVNALSKSQDIKRLTEALALSRSNTTMPMNKHTRDSINFLKQYLAPEQFETARKAHADHEKSKAKTIASESLIPQEARQALEEKLSSLKRDFEAALLSKVPEQLGLTGKEGDLKTLHLVRKKLSTKLGMLQLCSLDNDLIKKNKISHKKDSESISNVLKNIKGIFRATAFEQDLQNISSLLTAPEELQSAQNLAMLVTDDPQMLFNIGKYPIGCASCQNYEGTGSLNKSLLGYVGDAHTSGAFLIDLSKLPLDLQARIQSEGFEAVKSSIPAAMLLEASIARSVVKVITRNGSNEPAIFIEPTYSVRNKADLTMNKYFNAVLDLTLGQTMKIRVARGGTEEEATVPASANPEGQYEDGMDGDIGNAGMGIKKGRYHMSIRLVDRFSPVTNEDIQIAEYISSSGRRLAA